MMLTPAAFVRVGLLLALTLVLQVSAAGAIGVDGARVDLIPLVVAAVALYGGSITGAAAGFAMGVILDLATGGVMGISSLVLTAVGYGVGRFRELRDPAHGLTPIAVGAAATLGWVTAFATVSFMLDIGATVSPLVLRDMLITTVIGALLALPVFALCRRVLRPSLVVDPFESRRRRRQPREAGPLGLRGLEFGGR
jgi:rod shape-determining protein MreD